jgi:aarF domain-containing kinase
MEYVNAVRIDQKDKILNFGFGLKDVMDTTLNVFAAMVFEWGWVRSSLYLPGKLRSCADAMYESLVSLAQVHCDPHPGNILVRPNPLNTKKAQVVLVDHGLCTFLPLHERPSKPSLG